MSRDFDRREALAAADVERARLRAEKLAKPISQTLEQPFGIPSGRQLSEKGPDAALQGIALREEHSVDPRAKPSMREDDGGSENETDE